MTLKTRGIARGVVVRKSVEMSGCGPCCMFEDDQCQNIRGDVSCINGHLERVPPSEYTDEEKTALVTAHLIGEES